MPHPPEPAGAPGRPDPPAATDASETAGAPAAVDSSDAVAVAGRLRAVIQHLLPLLRGQSVCADLTPSRLATLAELADGGPMRIGELAERTGITLSTTSRMTDLLDGLGWIERRPDPADLRATLISVSAAGSAVLSAVRKEHADRLATRIARLPAGTVRALHDALPALEALATPDPAGRRDRAPGGAGHR